MRDNSKIKSEDFEQLLKWLDADREEAGRKYEQIRKGLIRFFRFKGIEDAENLSDETITRVTEKVSTFDNSKNVKTITYFYGFASNIFLEELRKRRRESAKMEDFAQYQKISADFDNETAEHKNRCLHECLSKISAEERQIFIEYYAFENGI